MKKQLSAHYVIAFDGTGHKVLENGHVVYEGHDIIYVGKDPYPGTVDESIDCGEAIISPGFIDLDALGDETDEENPTRQRLEQMAAQLEGGIDAFHVREKN